MKRKYNIWEIVRNIPKIEKLESQIQFLEENLNKCDNFRKIKDKELKYCKTEIKRLKSSKQKQEYELLNEIEKLEKQLNKLKKQNKKSIKEFKTKIFDKLKISNIQYNFDGKGKKPVQMVLNCNKDCEKYYREKLIKPYLKSHKPILDIDDLVLDFVKYIYRKNWKYVRDIDNYNKLEYWAKPLEALKKVLENGEDCDGFGVIMYTALRLLLFETAFFDDIWRLQCMVVKTITGGKHFNLAWLKSDICDWVFIETTYFKKTTIKSFENNIGLKQNLLYDKIIYSFDNENARKKLK